MNIEFYPKMWILYQNLFHCKSYQDENFLFVCESRIHEIIILPFPLDAFTINFLIFFSFFLSFSISSFGITTIISKLFILMCLCVFVENISWIEWFVQCALLAKVILFFCFFRLDDVTKNDNTMLPSYNVHSKYLKHIDAYVCVCQNEFHMFFTMTKFNE